MMHKPSHLLAQYGEQFDDPSVAAAYGRRPPYPDEVFALLEGLLPPGERAVLELGCGSGDLTLGLASRVDRIDAVDPAAAMLHLARARAGAEHAHIRWVASSAEAFEYSGPYGLVVAAESLHWMDWNVVLAKAQAALAPGSWLAIITARSFGPHAWEDALLGLIREYSTNQAYRPYDLVDELTRRDLFREAGRQITGPIEFSQPVIDYIESFHSRNGFSRDRMTPARAAAFDAALEAVVTPFCPDGVVRAQLTATLVWGRPSACR